MKDSVWLAFVKIVFVPFVTGATVYLFVFFGISFLKDVQCRQNQISLLLAAVALVLLGISLIYDAFAEDETSKAGPPCRQAWIDDKDVCTLWSEMTARQQSHKETADEHVTSR